MDSGNDCEYCAYCSSQLHLISKSNFEAVVGEVIVLVHDTIQLEI